MHTGGTSMVTSFCRDYSKLVALGDIGVTEYGVNVLSS
jgi:hypothetical protein